MDILSYNKVELAPCHPPKYWAKQKERLIHCYIMLDYSCRLYNEYMSKVR